MRRAQTRRDSLSKTPASEQLTASLSAEKLAIVQHKYHERRSRSIALIARMLQSYLRPYLWLLGISILLNVLIAATTGALPWFIQQAVDEVFNNKNQTMLVLIPLGVVFISLTRS